MESTSVQHKALGGAILELAQRMFNVNESPVDKFMKLTSQPDLILKEGEQIMSRKAYNVNGDAITKFPFSHAVESGDCVYLSGQPPMDLATGQFIEGNFASQLENCFANLEKVLEAAGLTKDDVVKCTVFLIDMRDYPAMNEIYAKQFKAPFPARSCVAVAGLPLGARVEVEMVAKRRK